MNREDMLQILEDPHAIFLRYDVPALTEAGYELEVLDGIFYIVRVSRLYLDTTFRVELVSASPNFNPCVAVFDPDHTVALIDMGHGAVRLLEVRRDGKKAGSSIILKTQSTYQVEKEA